MAELARVPLLYQPGEAWLYDTCSTLQGVLIARVAGQSLSLARSGQLSRPREVGPSGRSGSAAPPDTTDTTATTGSPENATGR